RVRSGAIAGAGMTQPLYRRVVAKISGEALMGGANFAINPHVLESISADLVAAQALGTAIGIVIGGGNIVRGASQTSIPRVTADMMGMLGTIVNALALASAIAKAGGAARLMSALAMPEVCETYERGRALRHLERGRLVLF